jgi:hypothetical protein
VEGKCFSFEIRAKKRGVFPPLIPRVFLKKIPLPADNRSALLYLARSLPRCSRFSAMALPEARYMFVSFENKFFS